MLYEVLGDDMFGVNAIVTTTEIAAVYLNMLSTNGTRITVKEPQTTPDVQRFG
jgi:hypothetical protein